MEHEEYTCDNYPCSGKKYNGEKAIISLTSWKARINTVSKTLFSLIKECPGFHIVLVLSEEEFPKKEAELPENLMLFVNNNLIELLWVYKNYKSLKKIIPTMLKYKNIPIISADDDCLYKCNYAQELYEKWVNNKTCVVRYNMFNKNPNWYYTQGQSTIYPPYVINLFYTNINTFLKDTQNGTIGDDTYYTKILKKNNIKILNLNIGQKFCFIFHDEINPLSTDRIKSDYSSCYI